MPDNDLDALIAKYRMAVIVYTTEFKLPGTIERQRDVDEAEAVLRARLAPTPHADDDAALDAYRDAVTEYVEAAAENDLNTGTKAMGDCLVTRADLERRLCDLRARAEAAEAKLTQTVAALKEAEPVVRMVALTDADPTYAETHRLVKNVLKTKEPTDG